ncbi:MAG: RluA family pseudouridine synthase [Methylobacterium mesophilicum]|nr:RluA family pseudouridine synthase [Methylobacterium mesophilicum]
MSASHKESLPASESRVVPDDARGTRLDAWLASAFTPDLSRARAQSLIRDGHVLVDGKASEAKHRLRGGETVAVRMPEPEAAEPEPEDIPLSVLFEDDWLIVIDKPAGLVVHPGAGNPSGTLVNALLFHCGDSLSGIGGVKRPGIVHRLDAQTSGVMVVAKTDRAHRALAEAFADHGASGGLERAYRALVWGAPEIDGGTVDAPLGRDPRDPTRRAVVPAGRADARHAVTRFRVEERFPVEGRIAAALLECRLETGRTHQIRVHMESICHPIIGDPLYGRGFRTKAEKLPEGLRERVRGFPRQALHAYLLGFDHPETGEPMRFESPLPSDMAGLVEGFQTAT